MKRNILVFASLLYWLWSLTCFCSFFPPLQPSPCTVYIINFMGLLLNPILFLVKDWLDPRSPNIFNIIRQGVNYRKRKIFMCVLRLASIPVIHAFQRKDVWSGKELTLLFILIFKHGCKDFMKLNGHIEPLSLLQKLTSGTNR